MFEKKAEEYIKEHTFFDEEYGVQSLDVVSKTIFKDGAEFGYNKCKEELNQKGLALQSDMDKTIEQNIALKKELEKANEWHKPCEKLPEECSLVLAYSLNDTEPSLWEFVANDQWEKKKKRVLFCSNNQIRLWKEIVLPKESE